MKYFLSWLIFITIYTIVIVLCVIGKVSWWTFIIVQLLVINGVAQTKLRGIVI